MLFLLAFLVLRYNYGNDYFSYYDQFNLIKSGNESRFLNDKFFSLIIFISPNFRIFIFITSAIYIYSIYRIIKMYVEPDYYWLSILILLINPYLFLIHLSTIRQTLAISLILLYITIPKHFKYMRLLLLFCAVESHFTSIAFFVIYYCIRITGKYIKFKHLIYLTCISFFVLIFYDSFYNIVKDIASILTSNYAYYLSTNLSGSFRSFIFNIIIVVTILFGIYNLNDKLDFENKTIVLLSFTACLITILGQKVPYSSRILMYFDIFHIITFVKIAEQIEYQKKFQFSLSYFKRNLSTFLLLSVLFVYLGRYYNFFVGDLYGKHYRHYETVFQIQNDNKGGMNKIN